MTERFVKTTWAATTWFALTVASVALTGSCSAPGPDPAGIEIARLPIVNGRVDDGHPFVGDLESDLGTCSGSLITSRTVLTAGHCINPASTNVSFRLGSAEFFAREVIRYPGYFEHQDAQGHVFDIDGDLAIVNLRGPVPNVDPVGISTEAPLVGDDIVFVGYGRESANGTSGVKRFGTNRVISVDPAKVEISRW
jgi:hypothetical protein